MLQLCPFCGHSLAIPLTDGIASCNNCSRIFDSTPMNRMLSAGWLARKKGYDDAETLIREGCSENEADVVVNFVCENNYSHEEFYQELKKIGISDAYTMVEPSPILM